MEEMKECPVCGEEVKVDASKCEHCDSTLSETENKSEAENPSSENDSLENKPALWNPQAAVNWSLLFSPVFGAWIHAVNWKSLGDEEQSKKSMHWVYGGIVFLFARYFPEFFTM